MAPSACRVLETLRAETRETSGLQWNAWGECHLRKTCLLALLNLVILCSSQVRVMSELIRKAKVWAGLGRDGLLWIRMLPQIGMVCKNTMQPATLPSLNPVQVARFSSNALKGDCFKSTV